jgi:hypothetical protein
MNTEIAERKMDAKIKAKWLKALRGGRYKQTYGQLKDGSGYCCLGVLCKVSGLKIDASGGSVLVEGRDAGYRPIGQIVGEGAYTQLYRMNDCEGKSFAQIADYIEANL